MTKILERGVQVLLMTSVLLWCADWALFRVRAARGTAFDTVLVQEFLSTPLKGKKTEYDYMGTAPETCARAVSPRWRAGVLVAAATYDAVGMKITEVTGYGLRVSHSQRCLRARQELQLFERRCEHWPTSQERDSTVATSFPEANVSSRTKVS